MTLTMTEIDDALTRANAVPVEQRGCLWFAHVDALLDQKIAQK